MVYCFKNHCNFQFQKFLAKAVGGAKVTGYVVAPGSCEQWPAWTMTSLSGSSNRLANVTNWLCITSCPDHYAIFCMLRRHVLAKGTLTSECPQPFICRDIRLRVVQQWLTLYPLVRHCPNSCQLVSLPSASSCLPIQISHQIWWPLRKCLQRWWLTKWPPTDWLLIHLLR